MRNKIAIYDENEKLYAITNGGAELNDIMYTVLKTFTLLRANALTDQELHTLTLQQAIDLKNARKGRVTKGNESTK
jgi:hypothetical protein